MTTKAGQKCTAIRRVLAPRGNMGRRLIAALRDRLGGRPLAILLMKQPAWGRLQASRSARRCARASAI